MALTKQAFKLAGIFSKGYKKTTLGMNLKQANNIISKFMSRDRSTAGDLYRRSAPKVNEFLKSTGNADNNLAKTMTKTSTTGSILAVGGVGMMGVAMMRGGMNQAHEIMIERYMKDSRYSSRLLTQTNLGSSSGNSSLSIGNTAGLSLSLSRQRHGF